MPNSMHLDQHKSYLHHDHLKQVDRHTVVITTNLRDKLQAHNELAEPKCSYLYNHIMILHI